MSLSNNFPVNSSNLNLSLANAGRLDPRVTFTRASTGTYYDGYSSAKAEENLLLQSQDFATSWTLTNVTVLANDTTAPDGTATADKITQTSTSNPAVRQQVTVSGTYQFSVFLKYIDIQWIRLLIGNDGAWFDVQNGVTGTTQGSLTSSIQASTNGFYRLIVNAPSLSGAINFQIIGQDGNGSVTEPLGSFYAWGAQLEQRSSVTSYTATTTAPITNYIPVLQTAAADVPRFDHNPTTRAALGLLVEEQRSNLSTYSEEPDNAAWNKTRASITPDIIVAPSGALTGSKLVEDTTASNTHRTSVPNISMTSGTSYTFSIYLKAAERTFAFVALHPTSSGNAFTTLPSIYVNLSTGEITNATATVTASSATSVGNGWWRVAISGTATSTTTNNPSVQLATAAGTNSYTGDGYSGIYLWGAQVEAGAFPTSYIATTTASVTRNADSATMTGTNFSAWYNSSQGMLLSEWITSVSDATNNRGITSIDDNSNNNRVAMFLPNSVLGASLTVAARVVSGGSATNPANSGSITLSSLAKSALAYGVGTDQAGLSVNGGTPTTASPAAAPVSPNTFRIGTIFGVNNLNGTIRTIRYYPVRNSNAQLQALTG